MISISDALPTSEQRPKEVLIRVEKHKGVDVYTCTSEEGLTKLTDHLLRVLKGPSRVP